MFSTLSSVEGNEERERKREREREGEREGERERERMSEREGETRVLECIEEMSMIIPLTVVNSFPFVGFGTDSERSTVFAKWNQHFFYGFRNPCK